MTNQDPRYRDCTVCGTNFRPRLSFQKERSAAGQKQYFCSLSCKARATFGTQSDPTCDICGETFRLNLLTRQGKVLMVK